jgi:hypothetical protein
MNTHDVIDYFNARGLSLPDELVEAQQLLESARAHLDVGPVPEHDLYQATAKNVTKIVDSIVEARMRADAITASRAGIEHVLNRRLVGAIDRAAAPMIGTLGPLFDTAAETFHGAHTDLDGVELTDAALVAAGPAILDAFHRARAAASDLDTLVQIRQQLHMSVRLHARAPQLEHVTRFVHVENLAEVNTAALLLASKGQLEPWASLATAHATLHWLTIDQQREVIARLDLPEPEPKPLPQDILKRAVAPEPARLR